MTTATIKGRTGDVLISPGFWWCQRKDDGSSTVVQVTDGKTLGVMVIGNLTWFDLDEATEYFEFMAPIQEP